MHYMSEVVLLMVLRHVMEAAVANMAPGAPRAPLTGSVSAPVVVAAPVPNVAQETFMERLARCRALSMEVRAGREPEGFVDGKGCT